jgi:hypothetical protein
VSNSQVAQRRLSGRGPVCSLCAHPDHAQIRADLDKGVPVTSIVASYGVTRSAVYRHRSAKHDVLQLLPLDPADMVGLDVGLRLLGMFDRAHEASAALYDAGDHRGGALVADHGLRAAAALTALKLVDADDIRGQIENTKKIRRDAYALARTVEQFLIGHPDLAEAMASTADSIGAHDLAAQLRDDEPEEQA